MTPVSARRILLVAAVLALCTTAALLYTRYGLWGLSPERFQLSNASRASWHLQQTRSIELAQASDLHPASCYGRCERGVPDAICAAFLAQLRNGGCIDRRPAAFNQRALQITLATLERRALRDCEASAANNGPLWLVQYDLEVLTGDFEHPTPYGHTATAHILAQRAAPEPPPTCVSNLYHRAEFADISGQSEQVVGLRVARAAWMSSALWTLVDEAKHHQDMPRALSIETHRSTWHADGTKPTDLNCTIACVDPAGLPHASVACTVFSQTLIELGCRSHSNSASSLRIAWSPPSSERLRQDCAWFSGDHVFRGGQAWTTTFDLQVAGTPVDVVSRLNGTISGTAEVDLRLQGLVRCDTVERSVSEYMARTAWSRAEHLWRDDGEHRLPALP